MALLGGPPGPRREFVRARCPTACLLLGGLLGCAGNGHRGEAPAPRPAEVRASIANLLPAHTPDRSGWAADIYGALSALGLPPSASNICSVLAIVEQESGYHADPAVAQLGRIAREEIDRRAERLGVPALAVDLALRISSPDGRSYGERIDAVKTEGELNQVFEDLIGSVPLGQRLFAGWNPVRTGGAMQVSIAFAERHARERSYPYPMPSSVRHEVFTRRGGLYFGIAHLLDYPAAYDRPLYRFADFNAGRYASRNAAFQSALSRLSGLPLALDGDLVRHDGDADARPGQTESAARAIGRRLELDDAAIRRALELDESPDFERSTLYRRVFEQADRAEQRQLPRALLPQIALRSPKITRKLSTEWFANRVDERHRRCLARATAPAKS